MLKISLLDSINVAINIGGSNTFADIDCLYLKEPAKNELADFYFYFNGEFIKELQYFVNNNNNNSQKQGEASSEELKAMVSICLFNDKFSTRKNKIYSLLSKVAFKDEELKQSIDETEIDKLALEDLQELVSSFLSNYLVVRWLKQLAK